ncbi:hypothetical protein D3C76_983810 [compost metagenome]
MNDMTIQGLVNVFQSEWARQSRFVGIVVQLPDLEQPEVIINPKENFEAKLAYYQKTYGEDLVMVHNANIKIIGYAFGNSFAEVQQELGIA